MNINRRLPEFAYNWVTGVGAILAAGTFSAIVLLLLMDLLVRETTLYLGLLTFIVLPVFVIAGLILMAVGALRERHRLSVAIGGARADTSPIPRQIHIDFQNHRHRNMVIIWVTGTALFLLGSTVGSYKAYQATESNEFCGQLCHDVMHPEFTAYQTSPHARVHCVECHIGSGADWFVKAKVTGAYQVYAVLAQVYPKPIETPIQNLRPARETCEECHWPEQFFGGRKDVNPHYLSDEGNTPYPITLMINIGGGTAETGRVEGIHWHMAIANKLEYIARDQERHDIAWIRSTGDDGQVRVYNRVDEPLSEEEIAAAEIRTMDCIDCHNRPSHMYRSPVRAVNEAIAAHWIDRTLPYIKREAVKVLDADYANTPAALEAIQGRLTSFYEDEYPEILNTRWAAVDSAIGGVQRVFQQNFFPEMKVSWRAYPDNIGHSQSIGCFRCHGEGLQTADGESITRKCTVCHSILSQGLNPESVAYSPDGVPFAHPVDIDGAELEVNCTECHEGGAELY